MSVTNSKAVFTTGGMTPEQQEQLASLMLLIDTKADQQYVHDQISALVGTSPESLNTIYELAAAIASETTALNALNQMMAYRVRFDIANQVLTDLQKSNARGNIGAEAVGVAAGLVAAETTARQNADTTLQNNIDAKEPAIAAGTANQYWTGLKGWATLSWSAIQSIPAALTQIAGLSPTDNDILQRKAGSWVSRTLAQLKADLALNNVDNTSDVNKPISTATQAALDTKLNASAYSNRFKGKFVSLSALQSAIPSGGDGDYAIVDAGAGSNAKQYIWDANEGWVVSADAVSSSATAAGADRAIQFNNAGVTAGAAQTSINLDGNLLLTVDNQPIKPASTSQVVAHMRQRAARAALAWTDGYGLSLTAQPSLSSNAVWTLSVPAASAAPLLYNIGLTVAGQATRALAYNLTAIDHITTRTRIAYQTTAIAGNIAYAFGGQRYFFYNSATTQAGINTGFRFEFEFGRDDATAVTGARMFIGLQLQTAAPTNVEPDILTRVIGLIKRSTDTNLQIYSANSSTTTPIDLGADFPANSLTNVYRLTLHSPKNTGRVFWDVVCINTGAVVSGEFAKVNLNNNINVGFFAPYWWITNNATAAAAALVVFDAYGDSPR